MSNNSVAGIFVYGTLRRGERLHHHMLRIPPARILEATTTGSRIKVGPYWALVDGTDTIHGEWFEYSEPLDDLLRHLDEVEGGSYRRILREVEVEGLGPRPAWLYEYAKRTRSS